MRIGAKEKLVMIGDSVTDCGRKTPVGEGLFDALGKGYAANVDSLLNAGYGELGIRVVNMGTSGNTVRDLKARWETDVMDLKPDWLSVMIGINDVWRQYDLPRVAEVCVGLKEYEKTLREILARVRPSLKGLVLMTPYYLEPNKKDAMRKTMDSYGLAVKKIAKDFDAVFVDTQAAFDGMWKNMYPASIGWDRVHPNQTGHMVLARAFLDGIGFDWTKRP
jgi:lysophospholipase L1-like esterase